MLTAQQKVFGKHCQQDEGSNNQLGIDAFLGGSGSGNWLQQCQNGVNVDKPTIKGVGVGVGPQTSTEIQSAKVGR